jgi:hypothetical protein
MSRGAVAFPVPHGPINQQWLDAVNDHAGRRIVQAIKIQQDWVLSTTSNPQRILKGGQFVLVIDPVGSTNALLYQIVDRVEIRA